MKKIASIAVAITSLSMASGIANAENGHPSIWQGVYIGGHIGGSFADFGALEDATKRVYPNAAEEGEVTSHSIETDGLTGGAHFGYNIQRGKAVFGIEGDVSFLKAEISAKEVDTFIDDGDDIESTNGRAYDLSWIASIRARLGYALTDKSLVYATAGAAWTQFGAKRFEENFRNGEMTDSETEERSELLAGFVIGGGAEYKILDNANLRGEVLHYQFEADKGVYKGLEIDTTVVRAGLSWSFN